MFEKKDERIKELEKRIEELEKQVDTEIEDLRKKTKEQIRDLGASLRTLETVMKKIQDERNEIEKDRDFLLEKHKELIRQIPVDRTRLKRDIREKLLMPLHRTVKENAELIKDVAVEGLEKNEEKPSLKKMVVKDLTGKAAPVEKQKKPVADAMSSKDDFMKSIKSAIVSEEMKTPIDELFELVMKYGIVPLPDAAKKFGVTEAQLEEWAKILESHGLIEIHYPAIGKTELRKKIRE